MDCSYTLDLLIEDRVIAEIKSVERVLPVHEAQLLTQLKLAGKPVGLLLNFNVPLMKDGVTRKLNRAALEVEGPGRGVGRNRPRAGSWRSGEGSITRDLCIHPSRVIVPSPDL